MSSPLEIDLIPNPQGVAFTRCTERFQVAVAGRRSGKTLRAKRKLAAYALAHVGRYAACAPTRDQAKGLFWGDLKALCAGVMRGEPRETELSIPLANGSEICVVGLDKPQRIEGRPWHGLLIDEFDDVKPEAWDENLRPALSDTLGFAWFIGVPEGFKNLYTFWRRGVDGEPHWASFQWPSSDVVPADELESARRTMDPRAYRQEYEASFEAPSGTIYDNFSRTENVKPCPFDANLPAFIGMDFNIDPMSAVIAQAHGPEVWITHGIEQRNSNSERFGLHLRDVLKTAYGRDNYPEPLLWVDPSGAARQHAMGVSDVDILKRGGFRVAFKHVRAESDKYNAVRAYILNAAGERRLFIDPSCKRLIDRLEQLAPDDEDDHLTDALGYLMLGQFPVGAGKVWR